MVIDSFSAVDFRNFRELRVGLAEGLNFIIGDNGQGKTNLVEGIFFINHLDSFRTRQLAALVRSGAVVSQIQGVLRDERRRFTARVEIARQGRRVWLDGQSVLRLSDYVSNFFAVVFSPSQLYAFRHNPVERRLEFDRYISFLDAQYIQALKAFKEVHAHKNSLLKSGGTSSLSDWNRLFVEKCYNITLSRTSVVDRINGLAAGIHEELAGGPGRLRIDYTPSLRGDAAADLVKLDRAAAQELKAGFALYGAHRDDYRMRLDDVADDRLSQGQYRLALMALKLAMSRHLGAEHGYRPVLILDDLFSELDATVRLRLEVYLQALPNQVFITATGKEHGVRMPGARVMEIRDGVVLQ